MFLPYRAKNPPEHFPYVTIGLIVVNTLIFALTSESLLVIREDVVQQYAVSHETMSLMRLFTAMFLHGSILHLAGNMLFLWIFGASVEGRLRPWIYMPLYLIAGLAGGLLHDLVVGFAHPEQFSLGASGAIMGVAGAYLYMFPYSMICIFWRFYFRGGVCEWQARWVVLLYVGLDILEGFLLRGGDGVGHFAHLGGFATGFLGVLLLRARRDSEEISTAQATHAEMKDYSLLAYPDLEALMRRPTEDMNLVIAFCQKALTDHRGMHAAECLVALRQYSQPLFLRADPAQLAWILLQIPISAGGLFPAFYLRLGSRLESMTSNDYAAQIYRRVYDLYPQEPDTEVALYRLGRIMDRVFGNRVQARAIYIEMLRLFPNGPMSLDARRALQQM